MIGVHHEMVLVHRRSSLKATHRIYQRCGQAVKKETCFALFGSPEYSKFIGHLKSITSALQLVVLQFTRYVDRNQQQVPFKEQEREIKESNPTRALAREDQGRRAETPTEPARERLLAERAILGDRRDGHLEDIFSWQVS